MEKKMKKNVYTCIIESLCCIEVNVVTQLYFNNFFFKKREILHPTMNFYFTLQIQLILYNDAIQ